MRVTSLRLAFLSCRRSRSCTPSPLWPPHSFQSSFFLSSRSFFLWSMPSLIRSSLTISASAPYYRVYSHLNYTQMWLWNCMFFAFNSDCYDKVYLTPCRLCDSPSWFKVRSNFNIKFGQTLAEYRPKFLHTLLNTGNDVLTTTQYTSDGSYTGIAWVCTVSKEWCSNLAQTDVSSYLQNGAKKIVLRFPSLPLSSQNFQAIAGSTASTVVPLKWRSSTLLWPEGDRR